MKFSEMKIAKGPDPKWTALIADKNGNKDFELAIRGPETLVAQVFEKANFDFEIDPDTSRESAAGRLKELHQKWAATAKEPFADPGHGFFKKPVRKLRRFKFSRRVAEKTTGKRDVVCDLYFWGSFFQQRLTFSGSLLRRNSAAWDW